MQVEDNRRNLEGIRNPGLQCMPSLVAEALQMKEFLCRIAKKYCAKLP
jgi:hypothetical protein